MISLSKYLEDGLDLFEESYKITKCRFKVNGIWEKARINLKTGIIYGLNGQILRKCNIRV